jgi:hypothetical protein
MHAAHGGVGGEDDALGSRTAVTIRLADRVGIGEGRVLEIGTHDELLAAGGALSQLPPVLRNVDPSDRRRVGIVDVS